MKPLGFRQTFRCWPRILFRRVCCGGLLAAEHPLLALLFVFESFG
jgi:hypothetical protein